LYAKAAKWSTTLKPEVYKELSETTLREKIPLSLEGYEKHQAIVDDLQEKIRGVIQPVKNVQASPFRVILNLKEAFSKASKSLKRGENLAKLEATAKQFLVDWGHGNLTVENAHRVKIDIYQMIKNHYNAYNKVGTGLYADGEIAALKGLAVGLKKEVERLTGGDIIKNLNARESKLLRVEPYLARAVGRTSNLNIHSLDDVLVTIAGATISTSKKGVWGTAAYLLNHFLGSPEMKSRIAIMLQGWRDWATTLPPRLRGEAESILNNTTMQDTKKIDFLSDLSRRAPRIAGPAASGALPAPGIAYGEGFSMRTPTGIEPGGYQNVLTGPAISERTLPAPQRFIMRPTPPETIRRPYPESTGQMVGEYPEVVMKGAKNNILGSDLEVAKRIKGDIQAAQSGTQMPLPDGTWTGQRSTWPAYLKGRGHTTEHLNHIIDKAIAGEKLTELERRNFNTIVKAKLAEEEEMIAAMNKNALAAPMKEIPTTGGRARSWLEFTKGNQ
jgi:hypothetical protein